MVADAPAHAPEDGHPENDVSSTDSYQTSTLQVVQEDGQGGLVGSSNTFPQSRRAHRTRPLSSAKSANASLRRKRKVSISSTCHQTNTNLISSANGDYLAIHVPSYTRNNYAFA
ncbi:hypothetical protein BDV40DRAFT_300620 [Aspergillus tamarii]|uniref:Uncharacterized protein n=1 Tax=Aspergillus tamarii TaxID=41984 RepID=A0A5N6UWK7_ASPTM|nr:hypothetical protein BDV40DRAFT_300620 [Aspergillus tamarii]